MNDGQHTHTHTHTHTILLTWHHILVRKVHIKFQCQRASSFGEKVEQTLKKAKNH